MVESHDLSMRRMNACAFVLLLGVAALYAAACLPLKEEIREMEKAWRDPEKAGAERKLRAREIELARSFAEGRQAFLREEVRKRWESLSWTRELSLEVYSEEVHRLARPAHPTKRSAPEMPEISCRADLSFSIEPSDILSLAWELDGWARCGNLEKVEIGPQDASGLLAVRIGFRTSSLPRPFAPVQSTGEIFSHPFVAPELQDAPDLAERAKDLKLARIFHNPRSQEHSFALFEDGTLAGVGDEVQGIVVSRIEPDRVRLGESGRVAIELTTH